MRNINPEKPIKNFRALHSFCTYNCLPSGRISKLQGGYYILNDELKWELISSTLDTLTFRELYEKLSKLSNIFEIQRERIEFLEEEVERLTKLLTI